MNEKEKVALGSIAASAGLTAAKGIIGVLTGSLAILSEAGPSLLDSATVLTYFAVRISGKPADAEHQYGHGKVESITALAETALLFLLTAIVVFEAVRRLIGAHEHAVEATIAAFAIIIGSIVIDTANPVAERLWYEVVQQTLKRNDVKLVTYVPDKVFTPLIRNLHADPDFLTFPTAREEEALGILSGAWMGGRRGAVLMQTSGFGTIPNVLASLIVPYQVPAIMFVSERGTLGEFNLGQALVCRTMRPVLESLAVEFHTIARHDELEFIVDRSIKQAVATQAAVAFVLSPLLTGGKVFEA